MKGRRGATYNPDDSFQKHSTEYEPGMAPWEEQEDQLSTKCIAIHPKTILNKVESPDVPYNWSMNPYQGCEHGCIYCYARPTHNYWGYSAGLDFEKVVLYKPQAADLLRTEFARGRWKPAPIMLSGNTDCYQPVERRFGLTRELLITCNDYGNPAAIITKNALIGRDMDLLQEMSSKNMIAVAMSITTMNTDLQPLLEPRAASGAKRMQLVRRLSDAGIPVSVMMAPIIPGLNDDEIPEMIELAKENGAYNIGFTMVRLNGPLEPLFQDWIEQHFPDKAERVMMLIREIHQGRTGDSSFGRRMRGQGPIARSIHKLFAIQKEKVFGKPTRIQLATEHFTRPSNTNQLSISFD